jgi:hypothetical protein
MAIGDIARVYGNMLCGRVPVPRNLSSENPLETLSKLAPEIKVNARGYVNGKDKDFRFTSATPSEVADFLRRNFAPGPDREIEEKCQVFEGQFDEKHYVEILEVSRDDVDFPPLFMISSVLEAIFGREVYSKAKITYVLPKA